MPAFGPAVQRRHPSHRYSSLLDACIRPRCAKKASRPPQFFSSGCLNSVPLSKEASKPPLFFDSGCLHSAPLCKEGIQATAILLFWMPAFGPAVQRRHPSHRNSSLLDACIRPRCAKKASKPPLFFSSGCLHSAPLCKEGIQATAILLFWMPTFGPVE